MASQLESTGTAPPPGPHAFWLRLVENAFRRAIWLLIPVALFTFYGVIRANDTLELYSSDGLLSASSNPLVPDQDVGGVARQFWESPAVAASRTINEQLRTDAFVSVVAEQAGLGAALEAGLIGPEIVRASVGAYAEGTTLVKVSATWSDPRTAWALADSVIAAFQNYVADTVSSDFSEAEAFYSSQFAQLELEVTEKQEDLDEFAASLDDPDGALSATEQTQLTRLTDALTAAERRLTEAQQNIDRASLQVSQAQSEAGRLLTIIDEPSIPSGPQSTLQRRIMTVASFLVLGIVVAFGALLVGTVLDKSVVSTFDIRALEGVTMVTAVPVLNLSASVTSEQASESRPWRRKRRKPRREPTRTKS